MKLLKEVLQHLQTIQGSRTGSIGTMHNVYLPQLKRKFVDDLATEVSDYLANEAPGIELISAERRRHFTEEGFDADHDAQHRFGELRIAAACYATEGTDAWVTDTVYDPEQDAWPWDPDWDKRKKHNRMRRLAIAGALIAAEIDRICALEPDIKK